jgi:hypothetical protein
LNSGPTAQNKHSRPEATATEETRMGIRDKLERLVARLHDTPQYNSQGAVLFVDLEQRRR